MDEENEEERNNPNTYTSCVRLYRQISLKYIPNQGKHKMAIKEKKTSGIYIMKKPDENNENFVYYRSADDELVIN